MRWFLKGMDADLDDSLCFRGLDNIGDLRARPEIAAAKSQPGRKNGLQRQNLLSRAGVFQGATFAFWASLPGFNQRRCRNCLSPFVPADQFDEICPDCQKSFAPYRGRSVLAAAIPQSPFYVERLRQWPLLGRAYMPFMAFMMGICGT